jgi:VanZ family protein
LISRAVPRLLFWGAAVFAFVMAVLPHPPRVPGSPSDKILHIAAFTTLAALGSWAYRAAPAVRLLIGLSLFGAAIELAQAIPGLNRDSDVIDWLADTAAAGVALLTVSWWRSGAGQRRSEDVSRSRWKKPK